MHFLRYTSCCVSGMRRRSSSSLRDAFRQPPAVVVGRTVAVCAHPVAAWQVLPASWRILMFTVYTVASYLTVLSVLVALKP